MVVSEVFRVLYIVPATWIVDLVFFAETCLRSQQVVLWMRLELEVTRSRRIQLTLI